MKKTLAATALALATATSAAFAGEPVELADAQLDQVTAGGPPPLTLAVFKNVAIQKLEGIQTSAELKSVPYVRGNLAEAE